MKQKRYVVSFSGGKDSTAMVLRMHKERIKMDDVIFADSSVEFPSLYEHIDKVEKHIGRKIIRVKAEHDFLYYLSEYRRTKGSRVDIKGLGFPDHRVRWCTKELKTKPIMAFFKKNYSDCELVEYHGIAYDERERTQKNQQYNRTIKYPLVYWKMTSKDALDYCYANGFDWGGLYHHFSRLSCWCCPLKRMEEYKYLYQYYPELWDRLRYMESVSFRKFLSRYSVAELENKFDNEIGLVEKEDNSIYADGYLEVEGA